MIGQSPPLQLLCSLPPATEAETGDKCQASLVFPSRPPHTFNTDCVVMCQVAGEERGVQTAPLGNQLPPLEQAG